MTHHEITVLLLSFGLLLGLARLLGEVARYFRQPAVVGEILAGILLGPTVLGQVSPELSTWFFPAGGSVAVGREAIALVAVVLFLLVAGMEVDLSTAFRQGKVALSVSTFGMVIPFVLGFAAAWLAPGLLMEVAPGKELVFALFFATALSISALPVIAKILIDLNLIKTDMGVVVIASAILNDLIGWMIFAVVLGMMGSGKGGDVGQTIALTVLFAGLMLTVGRVAVHRALPWLQAHLSWPSGVLGFAMTAAFFCAALTEWIGIHAIFGSFLFGVALGDSRHLRERTRATLDQFISSIFAPIFFASIGLRVNFVDNFELLPVVAVFIIATAGKLVGCGLGARVAGVNKQESWAIGWAMNARGAMEIILGLLALQYGVIDEKMFVALVIMALGTSMMGGFFIQRFLQAETKLDVLGMLSPKLFQIRAHAASRREAIELLSHMAANGVHDRGREIAEAVWDREQLAPTGLANMVAVPHARLDGLATPMIVTGIFSEGVDFDATDGQPARLVFLILTPKNDNSAQLQILAGIAAFARHPEVIADAADSRSFTEFLAALRTREK